ncbi:MAG TPA: hypothetical protein VG367_08850 [Mucilaginibacter sp.]|jgi:hypothetical protein|nr:hypothetical protein [Mucilaginibacter sp.]
MDKEIIKALCNTVILLGGTEKILPVLRELQNGKANKGLLSKLKDFNLDCEESLKFRLSNQSYIQVNVVSPTGKPPISAN